MRPRLFTRPVEEVDDPFVCKRHGLKVGWKRRRRGDGLLTDEDEGRYLACPRYHECGYYVSGDLRVVPFVNEQGIALHRLRELDGLEPSTEVVLVGSRALALVEPRALLRSPADFDYICTTGAFISWMEENGSRVGPHRVISPRPGKLVIEGDVTCEFELADYRPSTRPFIDIVGLDAGTRATPMGLVPSLDLLFLLKSSHRYLKNSPHFWKTLADYHAMKRLGARIRPEHQDLFRMRERETYDYAHPRLNQNKAGFFSEDQVMYVYDHDSVHRAVALFGEPAYTMFQRDGEEVAVDRKKFEALSPEIKLASVIEESAVLAIERSLVPFPGAMTPEQAWRFALSKVCTSITSGWWREFAYENALEVLRRYPRDYHDRFLQGVADGSVVRL